MKPKQVLIAHQNSIPHYRVRFYELLEERRPRNWEFRVVFDTCPERYQRFFKVPVDPNQFRFPIHEVRSLFLHPKRDDVVWQTFFLAARHADLLITDTYVKNLTYPLSLIWKLFGRRRIFWGMTRDTNVAPEQQRRAKRITEWFKQCLFRLGGDAFFTYTQRERDWLVAHGWPENRVFSMNNTVDVVTQRKAYDALAPLRNSLRAELGVSDKRVLIYSGRIIRGKRIEFLLEAFEKLYSRDPAACLFVVGGGDLAPIIERTTQCFPTGTLRYFGPVSDADMNRLLVAADLYVIPGQVGLAPLTAMCFDLPVVAFDLPIHSPEIEYLTPENSVILPASTTPEEFAEQLPKIFEQFSDPARRAKIYPSIAHLTMEAMVDRFIEGIERVFALDRKA